MLPSLLLSTLLATAATPAAARVVARGCGGHDLHAPSKRDLEEMMRRQTSAAPTDVASLKQITGMSLHLTRQVQVGWGAVSLMKTAGES